MSKKKKKSAKKNYPADRDELYRTAGYAETEKLLYDGQKDERDGLYMQGKAVSKLRKLVPSWSDVQVREVMGRWNGNSAPGSVDRWWKMGELYDKFPRQGFWRALPWKTLQRLTSVLPENEEELMRRVIATRRRIMSGPIAGSGQVQEAAIRDYLEGMGDPTVRRFKRGQGAASTATGLGLQALSTAISEVGEVLDTVFEEDVMETILNGVSEKARSTLEQHWKGGATLPDEEEEAE